MTEPKGTDPARQRGAATSAGGTVDAELADADERAIESALRPKRLTEFTGQARVREQLSLILTSALRRGRPPDHLLLCGPPGEGADGLPGIRPSRQAPLWRDQVQSGLVNLGWPVRDADQAISALEDEGVINGADTAVDVAMVLRAALRKLSRP